MNKGFLFWIRWVFILPGALVAGLLSTFLLHFILFQTLKTFVESYPELIERILTPFVIALTFVWTGCKIAPLNKFKVGVILSLLWFFTSLLFIYLTVTNNSFFGSELSFHVNGVASIMGIVGAFIGLIIVKKTTFK